ncbi:hypothetical protein F5Y19DRAFT_153366 [Xylariaceae sp. FL1651]|nr:hypothetical protein F5Y19DRAFT_153366 [Xylariaceae sp. FL1651]
MLVFNETPSVAEDFSVAPDASAQRHEGRGTMSAEEKGKEENVMPESSESVVQSETPGSAINWTEYGPPEGLKHIADVESDMVMQIIQESIDRIKARITKEEEERKTAAKAVKRRQEEAARRELEKAKQPEITDDQGDGKLSQNLDPSRPVSSTQDTSREDGTGNFPSKLPARPKKRILMNIFRKLNSGPERGESSAAGATRQRLLLSSSLVELSAYSARKHFVLDLIKKATGEETSKSLAVPIQEPEVECASCLDEFNPKDTVRVPCHHYCKPCFSRLIASACQNEQHWPPKCCLHNIPDKTIIINIDDELKLKYRARAAEWNIPVADRIYCSRPDCSLFIRPEYIIRAQGVARCTDGHYTCIFCRNPQHDGDDCPQDRDMIETNKLAESEGWKRCYGCHAYVEHREACQHMTCRCGAEFCYVCGAQWRTCACTMAQLGEVKRQAEARRQARLEREAQEEAEIQEAIRLVEEFEREEELKAELLRQEQERLAEERRQKELEERIRREGERRRTIAVKYEELREVFWRLNETQRVVIRQHHDECEMQLKSKADTELRSLIDQHRSERDWLKAKVEARISKREAVFKKEYAARVAEERRIEEQYAAKLQAFWDGKQDSEEKIEVAMRDLKKKMDAGFTSWKKWMDTELDTYRYHVQEEQAIREELMVEKERRIEGNARENLNAFAKRRRAELRWMREVFDERDRLLSDMELDEIENGEDIDAWFTEGPLEELSPSASATGDTVADMDDYRAFRVPGASE